MNDDPFEGFRNSAGGVNFRDYLRHNYPRLVLNKKGQEFLDELESRYPIHSRQTATVVISALVTFGAAS